MGSLGSGPSAGSGTWSLAPSQVSSNSMFKQGSDSQLLGASSSQQYMTHAFEPINSSFSKQQQGLFGSDITSPTTLKQEHLFFSEWPANKESWSNLDNDGSNQNAFSSTQLSMSIPRASSDFASETAYPANDESSFCSGASSKSLKFYWWLMLDGASYLRYDESQELALRQIMYNNWINHRKHSILLFVYSAFLKLTGLYSASLINVLWLVFSFFNWCL